MREIVLDTETTGLNPNRGDRVVEIGCVELINHVPSGEIFHRYVNPERDMPAEAFAVHGLSEDFLRKHPTMAEQIDDFLAFISDSPLIIHNAAFDMKFLNAELQWAGRPEIPMERAVDTLTMARRKFPGAQSSLDALCKRFGVDNTGRVKHGALLDSELLAEVYLELIGGREPGLELAGDKPSASADLTSGETAMRSLRAPRPHAPSDEELAAHAAFIARLSNPLWS